MNGRLETLEFYRLVADKINETINERTDYDLDNIGMYKYEPKVEVIPVWYSKCVQNHKGMFIVRVNEQFLSPYFIEATYNGDAQELYLDFYRKDFKRTIKCKSEERVE